jgi:hypothetical protein
MGIHRFHHRLSLMPLSFAKSILPSRLDLLWLASLELLLFSSASAAGLHRHRWLEGVSRNPGVTPRCGAVLGRSAVSTVLPLAVVATGRWLRRHNRGCADGVAAMVFLLAPLRDHLWVHFLLPLSLCSCLGGLASEPGMLAYCCCVCARAYDVILELLCWPLPTAVVSFSARFS